MRIGIDVHMVGERETGNETYVVNLLRALLAREDAVQYIPLTPNPAALEGPLGAGVCKRAIRVRPGPSLFRVLVGIPMAGGRHSLDLLHMTYIVPPVCAMPTVVTIHDISFEAYPETFSRKDRFLLRWGVPFSARRAARVIAVSEYTKRDLIRRYGLPEEKIRVTYEAAAPMFHPVKDQTRLEAARRRYGICAPYILSVGNLQPRKNLLTLLEAFRVAKAEGGLPHRLVVVGKQGQRGALLPREVSARGLDGEVIFTGYVPTEDLPSLYSGAALFVYPALYEGFGLPPLEAMACGAPVIASNAASLPEVLGDGAWLVDPRAIGGFVSAMRQVLGDPAIARRLSERGLARARQFSWDRTARQTVEVYEEVLAAGRAHRPAAAGRRVSSRSRGE